MNMQKLNIKNMLIMLFIAFSFICCKDNEPVINFEDNKTLYTWQFEYTDSVYYTPKVIEDRINHIIYQENYTAYYSKMVNDNNNVFETTHVNYNNVNVLVTHRRIGTFKKIK